MPYYHVSSYAKDGQVYLLSEKPLQSYIDEIESFSADSYLQFFNACDLIPDDILHKTGIRKSKWLCELVFESVRRENFNYAPRRLHSIYLCSSLEEARTFNEKYRSNRASIFETVFSGTVHQFDMAIFTVAEEYLFTHMSQLSEDVYTQLRTHACEYWGHNHPMEQVEYLYEGTVVLKLVIGR